MTPLCNHELTEFIYRRDGVDYVCCQKCHQVFEAADLEPVTSTPEDEETAS